MKVVILAGGFGTRIGEHTDNIPKPLIKIGEKPIVWHIMKIFSHYGYNDFVIALGYKGDEIKKFFLNLNNYSSDLKIDLENNNVELINQTKEKWNIILADTGQNTMTGGRVKKIKKYTNNKRFFLTYGDGVADINVNKLLNFHIKNKKITTMSTVNFQNNYGVIKEKNNIVTKFVEKPEDTNTLINAGFFVCEPEIFKYIKNDKIVFEKDPLEKLSKMNQLVSFRHDGFWHSMDTLKDKNNLEKLWKLKPKWKIWK